MNKDVVYIEPEEDITDIISKIEGSKSKIVALVPPKKAGVFRSIVNIKLITKSADAAEKTVVLVTTDPSIIKLAAATKMPVTKDLKTAPEIPDSDEEISSSETVDVDDEADDTEDGEDESKNNEDNDVEEDGDTGDITEDEEKDDDEETSPDNRKHDSKDDDKKIDKDDSPKEKPLKKSSGKFANSNNPVLKWIGTHKKADIAICSGLVVLIIFAIWAFVIAPAVTITLELETTTGNFSENVTFTQTLADEKVSEGKFYIEEKKSESKSEVEFEATGTKNVGDKANGTVIVYAYFKKEDSLPVRQGTTFTYNNLNFVSTEAVSLVWDGKDASKCDNKNNGTSLIISGCQLSARVKVEATDSGAIYNVAAATTGWSTAASGIAGVYSDAAMSGGTDKTVTIVQQSDIDKALSSTATENESENKTKLIESLGDEVFAIASSFKQTTSDPVSSPKVGEEVKDGKKAKLTVTTTSTIFVMDETKLKEFIKEKAKLSDGYKIYEMNDPFIENFMGTDTGYIGKLKTSYIAGSTITENEVVETVKGKGIGTAKRDLTDNFNGIKSITFDTSVPWVTSVPGNPEKITVKIDVKE